jgi:hypothetical protein
MFEKPQSEHQWLDRFVGEWTAEMECIMAPDQPPDKDTVRVTCRSLGGMWLLIESKGDAPDGGSWCNIMTLGYDPKAGHYTGTFISSMMTYLWVYSGAVDSSGTRLVLDCEGPGFDQGRTARFEETIEWVSEDHWTFSSKVRQKDGTWRQVMTAHHRPAERSKEKVANE